MRHRLSILARAAVVLAGLAPAAGAAQFYQQNNLASDLASLTPGHVDPNLQNPWGMSFGPATPFWSSDQVTGKATLYDGAGNAAGGPLIVTIPGGGTPGTGPTGTVFNSTASDFVLPVGGKSLFLFSTLNGTIVGWNGGSGTTGQVVATVANTTFTGLTLANNAGANFLYAADARGHVDVFNSTFQQVAPTGNFTDPKLMPGLTPYGIQAIGNSIYVTYDQKGVVGGSVAQFGPRNGNLHPPARQRRDPRSTLPGASCWRRPPSVSSAATSWSATRTAATSTRSTRRAAPSSASSATPTAT